jgi:hypothetical protein
VEKIPEKIPDKNGHEKHDVINIDDSDDDPSPLPANSPPQTPSTRSKRKSTSFWPSTTPSTTVKKGKLGGKRIPYTDEEWRVYGEHYQGKTFTKNKAIEIAEKVGIDDWQRVQRWSMRVTSGDLKNDPRAARKRQTEEVILE